MRLIGVLSLGAVLVLGMMPGTGAAQDATAKDKEALIQNAEAFVKAFHAGNAKAVAALWTADGDYTDTQGRTLKGRPAIEKAFADLFAEAKGSKVRIDSESLRFVTPDVALEEGVTSGFPPDGGPPARAQYQIVHVKQDGKWYLSSVRERIFTPPTNYDHLRKLEWLVGDWADANDKGPVARVGYSWTQGQNFLFSTYTSSFKNIEIGGGKQIIGYDPVAKQIRSWSFDVNGGFGEGTWTQGGNRWTIKTTATGQNGVKISGTTIVTRVDADTITYQSKDRTVDGKPEPDGPEVKMKRVK